MSAHTDIDEIRRIHVKSKLNMIFRARCSGKLPSEKMRSDLFYLGCISLQTLKGLDTPWCNGETCHNASPCHPPEDKRHLHEHLTTSETRLAPGNPKLSRPACVFNKLRGLTVAALDTESDDCNRNQQNAFFANPCVSAFQSSQRSLEELWNQKTRDAESGIHRMIVVVRTP